MWCAEMTKRGLPAIAAILLALAVPAAAQDEAGKTDKRPTVAHNAAPSPNATINLINLLVKQGVLSEEQAATLIKQADAEAYVARQAVRDAAAKAEGAEKQAATATDAVSPPGTKRVTYVPEIVKKQIRDDIKNEVMAKAEKENWASPGKYPEWAQRIRFYGDVRVRYEGDIFPKGNDPFSAVNYNAINTGNPYNIGTGPNGNSVFWPTFDTDKDRNRARLAARLGMEADLFNGFWAGVRIATGDSSSPVSFNQTLGGSTLVGSGGNFSKYGIWLDRAYIKYSAWNDLTFYAGRFENPFFTPTDLVYYRELGFDGFATQAKYEITPGITPFAVAGAFPIFNTALDAGSSFDFTNQNAIPGKAPGNDKWMFGGQLGSNVHLVPEVDFTFGAAYYDFTNVQGSLSTPCFVFGTTDFCSTDLSRPSFAQKGNTYMLLRNIVPQFDQNNNLLGQFQYFGLASAFRDVVLSGKLDLGQFDPVHIILDGEYVRNVAWNRDDVAAKALANPIPSGPSAGCINTSNANPCTNVYVGGNQGWLARLTVGEPKLTALWDWNAFVGYKWLESDAVIDAFTDSDFGLGGTNLKGYFVGGSLALGPNVWLSARWMSANQVAGAPYAVDVVQVDLNARF
jgi:Putative porin